MPQVLTTKTIWSTATPKAQMDAQAGANTLSSPQREMKMFDFCVRQRDSGFEAVFARVRIGRDGMPPETGLWWCRAKDPSGALSDWGEPIQIMAGEDRG